LEIILKRIDGRAWDELRPVEIIAGFQSFAEGSVLIKVGKTHVLCAISIEDRVPPFLKGTGTGWITAEYAMLPRATQTRTRRDSIQGHVGGRNQEIQRLIGRSLRAIADMKALGERTILIDCDVLQADGGTRTASITGSYIALQMAVDKLMKMGILSKSPLKCAVAATSVGIVANNTLLDLCYDEDSRAEVDFNIVMTSKGEFVEVQGTAEGKAFSRQAIDDILAIGEKGIKQLFQFQLDALKK
jgi:ribonuclease PH